MEWKEIEGMDTGSMYVVLDVERLQKRMDERTYNKYTIKSKQKPKGKRNKKKIKIKSTHTSITYNPTAFPRQSPSSPAPFSIPASANVSPLATEVSKSKSPVSYRAIDIEQG